MSMSKSIEKKMWGYEHPLSQFDLSADLLYNLERWADDMEISDLASRTAAELGTLIHLNERLGGILLRAAKQFPRVHLYPKLRPLSHNILHIQLHATRAFEWSNKTHGSAEPFWFWVEDDSGINILQLTRVSFTHITDTLKIDFIIPIARDNPPPFVVIRAISDRWIGAEDEITVPFTDLVMPAPPTRHSTILDLPLLRTNIQILDAKSKEVFARFTQFNSIQTQCLWPIYNSERNTLVSASSSSGKSILGIISIW
jgi:antiviral helicase SLH1